MYYSIVCLAVMLLYVCIFYFTLKQESKDYDKSDFNVKISKAIWIVGILGVLVDGYPIYTFIRYPKGTDVFIMPESLMGYIICLSGFSFFFMLSLLIIIWSSLWKIEVFGREDYFIYHNGLGRKFKVKYSECLEYKEKRKHNGEFEGIIVRTEKRRFNIYSYAANSSRFIHKIRCSNAKKVKRFTKAGDFSAIENELERKAFKYIYDANPVWVHCKKHFCPECGSRLKLRKFRKTVNSRSPEAKDYDFSVGKKFLVGDVEFRTMSFYCPECEQDILFKEMKKYESTKR